VIPPYIGLENGVECRGIVADNLYIRGIRDMWCYKVGLISHLLFDEEDSDMWGNWHIPHGNVSEKRRLSDTISADDAIPPAVCERERRSRAFRSQNPSQAIGRRHAQDAI
jgi:hypothetical protein